MIWNAILGILACLSAALQVWQWLAAKRFPLHQRTDNHDFTPGVTLLKSLKGRDDSTEQCLRSWLAQDYRGQVQVLFGVASNADPVCETVQTLIQEFAGRDIRLVVCGSLIGPNAKVSKLAELEGLAKHDVFVVSDADVRVPPDFLTQAVAPLRDLRAGLVNSFYRLANPATLAMKWEAVAVNADFWSQVLQSRSLKPMDFALGAVMITRRAQLQEIGGFKALTDCLADDYQLGHRIAAKGHHIALCPVVVECWDPPMKWRAVWKHQLRWARTIRVCQPLPYFFSILSNVSFWAILWGGSQVPQVTLTTVQRDLGNGIYASHSHVHIPVALMVALGICLARILVAADLQRRIARSVVPWWLVPVKDLLQAAIWLSAFLGNTIEWRGQKFHLNRDGTLIRS